MKFAATCLVSYQIGPDEWQTVTEVLVIGPDTTVKEIITWRDRLKGADTRGDVALVRADSTLDAEVKP